MDPAHGLSDTEAEYNRSSSTFEDLREMEQALSTYPERSPWARRLGAVRTARNAEDPIRALQELREIEEQGESPAGWVLDVLFDESTKSPEPLTFRVGELVLLPSGNIDTIGRVWPIGEAAGQGLDENTGIVTYQTDSLSRKGTPSFPTPEKKLEAATEKLPWPSWRTDLTRVLKKGLRELHSNREVTVITKKVAGVLKERTDFDLTVTHDGPAHHGLTGIDRWHLEVK